MATDTDEENGGAESRSGKDIVKEARERFGRAKQHYGASRVLAEADTRFALGDSDNKWQWPSDIAQQRETDKRVMLTVNTTAQHCNQIINQIRQNRPSGKVSPISGGAAKKSAEIYAGLIRAILARSNADDAHDVAAEHAVYGGEGYWRIVTDYESPSSFNVAIKVVPISNPFRVYVDHENCKELDKSDARWGFVFEDCRKEDFKREYPNINPEGWDIDEAGWVSDEVFIRAEYFWCEDVPDKALLFSSMTGETESCLASDTAKIAQLQQAGYMPALDAATGEPMSRDTKRAQWKHCFIVGGHDEPLDMQDWPGDYLPIVSVVGKEVNVNGEVVRKGVVRDLKDPARMVNFSYSEAIQTTALQNKIPYIAAAEAIEGHEDDWRHANTSNASYLPFNALDESGNALPIPKRQEPAVLPAAQIQLLQLSEQQMRAASGQQNANFGIKSEAQSGIGIQRLKAQGEIATFHFPDNLARALKYEWKILVNLIPRVYTRKQAIRVLGMDGKEEAAVLDPNHPQAVTEVRKEDAIERIFNPSIGEYDVVIDTGPSYQTQRQESAEMMTEMVKADPNLMAVAGDIIVRSLDFQDADKLADRLEKALPPGLADDKGGPNAQVMKLTQQLQQLQQESQQHIQEGLKLEQENESLRKGEMSKAAAAQAAREKALADAELKRQQMLADDALERERLEKQDQLERDRMAMEDQRKREQIDADNALEQYRIETQAGQQREAQMVNAEIAREGHMLAAQSKPEAPEKAAKKQRTVRIKAPSGKAYTATLNGDEIEIE